MINLDLLDLDFGITGRQVSACLFCLSAQPAMAMQAPKKVTCHTQVNATEAPGIEKRKGNQ